MFPLQQGHTECRLRCRTGSPAKLFDVTQVREAHAEAQVPVSRDEPSQSIGDPGDLLAGGGLMEVAGFADRKHSAGLLDEPDDPLDCESAFAPVRPLRVNRLYLLPFGTDGGERHSWSSRGLSPASG